MMGFAGSTAGEWLAGQAGVSLSVVNCFRPVR